MALLYAKLITHRDWKNEGHPDAEHDNNKIKLFWTTYRYAGKISVNFIIKFITSNLTIIFSKFLVVFSLFIVYTCNITNVAWINDYMLLTAYTSYTQASCI